MSELTKEYLDKKLDSQTVEIKSYVDDRVDGLATKKDLENLVISDEEKIDDLAVMVARGFEEVKKELDVRTQVENLDHRMVRIEQALNIKS